MEDDKELSRLNQELSEHAREQQWGLYRNTLFQVGELLREKGSFEEALCHYLEVCYLDLNGPKNYGVLSDVDLAEGVRSFDPEGEGLFPGVLDRVDNVMEALGFTAKETKVVFDKASSRLESLLNLPVPHQDAWVKIEAEIFTGQEQD